MVELFDFSNMVSLILDFVTRSLLHTGAKFSLITIVNYKPMNSAVVSPGGDVP